MAGIDVMGRRLALVAVRDDYCSSIIRSEMNFKARRWCLVIIGPYITAKKAWVLAVTHGQIITLDVTWQEYGSVSHY